MPPDNSIEFFFRLYIFDTGDGVNDIEIFIYDFSPMDRKAYPDEWVRNHVSRCWDEEWVRKNCKLPQTSNFQVIGRAKLCGWFDPYPIEEYDEDSEILESRCIPVPEGWWEWKCRSGLSLDEMKAIDGYPTNETGP